MKFITENWFVIVAFASVVSMGGYVAFSLMVDEALDKMKKLLASNKAIQELVSGEPEAMK